MLLNRNVKQLRDACLSHFLNSVTAKQVGHPAEQTAGQLVLAMRAAGRGGGGGSVEGTLAIPISRFWLAALPSGLAQ